MKERLNYSEVSPEAMRAMVAMEKFVRTSDLSIATYELVKIRVSQINGCAFCLDMHTKEARKAGETEQRIYALSAWKETPFFTDKERTALEWAEELTLISENEVSDELYARMLEQFNEEELVTLTMAVIAINGWNRLAISFRTVPGSYTTK